HATVTCFCLEHPEGCARESTPPRGRSHINCPQGFTKHQLAVTKDLAGFVNCYERDNTLVALHPCPISGDAMSINWPVPQVQNRIRVVPCRIGSPLVQSRGYFLIFGGASGSMPRISLTACTLSTHPS